MKVTTLIPSHRNDGSKVSVKELNAIRKRLWSTFEGTTRDGRTHGEWVDPNDGKRYSDVCEKMVIETDRARLAEITELIKEIGRSLGQKAMYMEVHYDGVQFLRTDD